MNEDRIVFEEPIQGRNEVLRAAFNTYQGKNFIHIRVWFWPEGVEHTKENLRPGKGLGMLTSQYGMIARAVRALGKAIAEVPQEAFPAQDAQDSNLDEDLAF